MKHQDLRIGIKAVWFLIGANLVLTIFGAIAKIQHWQFSQILLSMALILFFSTWIIILSDMVKNHLYNKTFWILTMFILPFISPIFYLTQRKRLIRLGQK